MKDFTDNAQVLSFAFSLRQGNRMHSYNDKAEITSFTNGRMTTIF